MAPSTALTNRQFGREVAAKVILPHYANRPDFIRRFEAEAQPVARLEHLRIALLHDYWRDSEGAFLIMRWLREGSVADALREGPSSLEPATMLLDQVCAALTIAHAADVVHRDLEPSNIDYLDNDDDWQLGDAYRDNYERLDRIRKAWILMGVSETIGYRHTFRRNRAPL